MTKILAPAFSLAVAVIGCSSDVDEEGPATAAHAITKGSVDTSDEAVVALRNRSLLCGTGIPPECTGTLVAPRVLVTAAHCVDHGDPQAFEVVLAADLTSGGEVFYAQDVLVHPQWDPTTRANDIALVTLTASAEVTPPPLATSMDDQFIGVAVRLVGFGGDAVGAPPGVKRTGTATVSSVASTEFRVTPSPSMSCQGDSGGPVFVTVGDTEYLLGVTSWGDPACAEFGVNTRIDSYLAGFIQPYLDSLPAAANTPDAGPARAAPGDVCTEVCADSSECPDGTECRAEDGVMRCGVQGLPHGYFAAGTTCKNDADCVDGVCFAGEAAGRPACTCYTLCDPPPRPDDCGCSSSPDYPGSALWLALATLGLALMRRPRRRRAR